MAADREVVPEAPQPVYDWRRAGYPFEHGEEVVRFLREHLDGEHKSGMLLEKRRWSTGTW